MTAMISTAADPQRAAVLVMLLAEDDATGLLSRLSPEELRLLGSKMVELGEIGPGAIADAIAGFAERADQAGLPAQDRSQDVRRLMTGAVGELKADNLMRGIAPAEARKPATSLELARWLDPEVIISLVADEHPQAIAVLLLQLDPHVAAQVLAGLPGDAQTPVVHRVARLGPIAPEAITVLEELLTAKVARTHGALAAACQSTAWNPVLKTSTKRTSRVYDENVSGFSAPFALPSAATPSPAVSAAGTVTTLGRPGALGICDG